MWRSWLAHLVWDQRVVCSSHITPTKLGEILQAGIPPQGGITFWGLNDKDSWVGEKNHPLVWKGSKYEKKKAYDALYVYLCELNGISPYKQ